MTDLRDAIADAVHDWWEDDTPLATEPIPILVDAILALLESRDDVTLGRQCHARGWGPQVGPNEYVGLECDLPDGHDGPHYDRHEDGRWS